MRRTPSSPASFPVYREAQLRPVGRGGRGNVVGVGIKGDDEVEAEVGALHAEAVWTCVDEPGGVGSAEDVGCVGYA